MNKKNILIVWLDYESQEKNIFLYKWHRFAVFKGKLSYSFVRWSNFQCWISYLNQAVYRSNQCWIIIIKLNKVYMRYICIYILYPLKSRTACCHSFWRLVVLYIYNKIPKLKITFFSVESEQRFLFGSPHSGPGKFWVKIVLSMNLIWRFTRR